MSLRFRATAAAYTAVTTFLFACASAYAAKGVPPQPSHGEDQPLNLPADSPRAISDATGSSSGGSLVRTFVGLAVVIGVIYGLYWVLRQVKASREERSTGSGLSSQAVVALGPNRSLHLVRAGRELVLVGVAEQGVTPIRRYTEEEALTLGLVGEEPTAAAQPAAPGVPGAVAPGPMTIGQALDKLRAWTVRK